MSKITKFLLAILYCTVLFIGVYFIVEGSTKPKRFKEYTDKPYNEDLYMNVQVYEVRQDKEETKTDFEYVKYDMGVSFYKQQAGSNISNLYVYVGTKTKDGKYSYNYSRSSSTLSSGTYKTGAIQLLNSSTQFAYKKITKDDNNKIIIEDYTPEEVYVKVKYNISYKDDPNQVVHAKELNYKFKFKELDTNDFKNYEQLTINYDVSNSKFITTSDSVFSLKVKHTEKDKTSSTVAYDSYTFSKFEMKNAKLEEGENILDSRLSIYGKIDNSNSTDSKYFNNYIRLFSNYGAKERSTYVSSERLVNISKSYGVKTLYFNIYLKTSNDRVFEYKYFVEF